MTPSADLPVPDAAFADLVDLLKLTPKTEDGARVLIRSVAAPVVAAVLRGEADASQERGELGDTFRARLRARADQLDPSQ